MIALDDTNFWNKKEKTGMNANFFQFFILIMIILGGVIYGYDDENNNPPTYIPYPQCPTCMQYVATWDCPKCGYTNYDEAHYCPVCGTHKIKRNKHD